MKINEISLIMCLNTSLNNENKFNQLTKLRPKQHIRFKALFKPYKTLNPYLV